MEKESQNEKSEALGSVSLKPASPTDTSIDAADISLTSAEYRKLIWKLDLRLLPPLFILWFISLIDRVNIGTARLQGLEKDLGMNPKSNQFNIATGMCFGKRPERNLSNIFSSCCFYRFDDRGGNSFN